MYDAGVGFSMEWATVLLKIMLINIVLSGDNAIVIAMACRHLPEAQRRRAIWWGSLAAVALRLVLVFIAVWLLKIPYVQAVGAMLLMYIAVKLADDGGKAHTELRTADSDSLWSAVRTILLADFVMSLDNVLAIAAIAKGQLMMTVTGVLLSIPIIIWGSSFVVHLLDRYPVLNVVGAGILGYSAGEMLLGDHRLHEWVQLLPHHVHVTVPAVCALFAVLPGLLKLRRDSGRLW
jgi:YjbE family integral membrane protein